MYEVKPELSSRFLPSLVHKRTTHTLSQMPPSLQYLKKIYLEIQKKVIPLSAVEVTTIINPLKSLQLCRNLLSQLKTKTVAAMLFRLILLILLKVLDIILSEFLRWVLLLLWTRLKKKIILLTSPLKFIEMKNSNIWKIIIGAVSAALGYILNAIGL